MSDLLLILASNSVIIRFWTIDYLSTYATEMLWIIQFYVDFVTDTTVICLSLSTFELCLFGVFLYSYFSFGFQ